MLHCVIVVAPVPNVVNPLEQVVHAVEPIPWMILKIVNIMASTNGIGALVARNTARIRPRR